jgi:hypothetical protein
VAEDPLAVPLVATATAVVEQLPSEELVQDHPDLVCVLLAFPLAALKLVVGNRPTGQVLLSASRTLRRSFRHDGRFRSGRWTPASPPSRSMNALRFACMLRLCGCDIDPDDARKLADDLDATGAPEAAAAIRWSNGTGDVDTLEPDISDAILRTFAAATPTGTLASLRDALTRDCT